jgi:hypothetical protein
MRDKWTGMSDREAFVELLNDVRETLKYAHRMRGNTTDEDLVEKLIWRIEGNIGYEGENDLK